MARDWLKKAAAAVEALNGEVSVDPAGLDVKHPALACFMIETSDLSGQPRVGCRLTIFVDDGHWKASLSDPNTEASLYVTLERPQDAFAALDKALRADMPDWRPWRRERGQPGKKGGGRKRR